MRWSHWDQSIYTGDQKLLLWYLQLWGKEWFGWCTFLPVFQCIVMISTICIFHQCRLKDMISSQMSNVSHGMEWETNQTFIYFYNLLKNALKCNLLQWNQNLVSFTTSLNFIFPWITYWSPNPMMVPWRSLADTILFSSWSKNKWSIDNHWHFYLPGFNYSLNSTFPCWLFVHKQNICADEHLL